LIRGLLGLPLILTLHSALMKGLSGTDPQMYLHDSFYVMPLGAHSSIFTMPPATSPFGLSLNSFYWAAVPVLTSLIGGLMLIIWSRLFARLLTLGLDSAA
ncbi:MAG TPA: hypothetical protein VEO95_01165, partial [Chthoniobacteraceae bacterium]|nr:hypothetical protein [Chthoniobacteraceae bacterium]